MFTPSSELVDAYLSEIAKGYGVNWAPLAAPAAAEGDGDDGDGDVKVRSARLVMETPRLINSVGTRKRETLVQPSACRRCCYLGGSKERGRSDAEAP